MKGEGSTGTGSGSDIASNGTNAPLVVKDPGTTPVAPPDAAVAAITIDAAPVLPPVPAKITFKIESTPRGAEITNLDTGKKYGVTPVTLEMNGSHQTLLFQLHKSGYVDATFDLTPDQDGSINAKLEKGSGTAVRQVVVKNPPGTGSNGAVTRPDNGSAAKVPDHPVKPPPDEDDCPELPCTKKVVTGLREGGGSGSGS
ncbi:hypothetical protein BH11MYX3_BH11MYX3_29160 [soil metagenome]